MDFSNVTTLYPNGTTFFGACYTEHPGIVPAKSDWCAVYNGSGYDTTAATEKCCVGAQVLSYNGPKCLICAVNSSSGYNLSSNIGLDNSFAQCLQEATNMNFSSYYNYTCGVPNAAGKAQAGFGGWLVFALAITIAVQVV